VLFWQCCTLGEIVVAEETVEEIGRRMAQEERAASGVAFKSASRRHDLELSAV
jgi:hypothetical protein